MDTFEIMRVFPVALALIVRAGFWCRNFFGEKNLSKKVAKSTVEKTYRKKLVGKLLKREIYAVILWKYKQIDANINKYGGKKHVLKSKLL